MPDDIKLPDPYCHLYEYDSWAGLHRSFYPGTWNGMQPSRTVPVYTADQVRAAVEADRAQRKPLTDEQVYGVVSSIGPDVMELAKQWADNEIHSYSLAHQAEVLAAEIVRRTEAAHGIPAPKGGSEP